MHKRSSLFQSPHVGDEEVMLKHRHLEGGDELRHLSNFVEDVSVPIFRRLFRPPVSLQLVDFSFVDFIDQIFRRVRRNFADGNRLFDDCLFDVFRRRFVVDQFGLSPYAV